MKKFILSSLSIALVLAGGTAFAATSISANATANIVSSIAITNEVGLNFGSIVSGPVGTVTVSTAGVRTASGSILGSGTGVSAASFTVTGDTTSTYAITLPSSVLITGPAAAVMTVDAFASNPSGTGTLTAGTQNLLVGATLHVAATQPVGSYTGTFDVSVAYN